MERLTNNKNVSDMSMIELAHNSCYADDERNARYRDYDLDIDARKLVRNLVKDICDEDLSDLSNEEFDEYMGSMLQYEIDSTVGLLALFYRNLWAMADLREKLKEYEDLEERLNKVYGECDGLLLRVVEMLEKHPCVDMANNTLKSRLITDEDVDKWEEYKQLEEQNRLAKLPCNVGDIVYGISMGKLISLTVNEISIFYMKGEKIINVKCQNDDMFRNYIETEFGKTVFLTKSEAEAKLKKLRGGND